MDDETALNLIQDYFEGKAGRKQFEAGLDYFTTNPLARSRLATLYQTLVKPGGLDCETVQERMLAYLDPVARAAMPEEERKQFLLHLAGCASCASEFLALRGFEQGIAQANPALNVPRFKIPQKTARPVAAWPQALKPVVQKIVRLPQALKITLRLEAAPLVAGIVRETSASYQTTSQEVLTLRQWLDPQRRFALNLTASRVSSQVSHCRVKVKLEGPPQRAGHTIILAYAEQSQEHKINPQGEAYFENIPVSALTELSLEINLKL